MKNSLYTLLLIGMFSSCIAPEEPPYPLPNDAVKMLAGESGKTWKLVKRFSDEQEMVLDDCYTTYRQIFRADHIMEDNKDSLKNCGERLTAVWKFAKDERDYYYLQLSSDQIPRLMGIKENDKLFKIKYLSENELVVEHPDNQFSSRLATITEIYIPEGKTSDELEYSKLISSLEE